MAGITTKTVSDLFGLAAGRCSICKIPVVQREVKIGEMAHIIAKRKGGARGALSVVGDINGYDNLILLCPNHHTEVDNNEAAYPLKRLHQIKDEHEAYVRQVFNHQSQGRVMDVNGLVALMQFLPFTQIAGLSNGLPTSFNMKLFYVEETCENFAQDFPHCRPFSDPYLENHFYGFWSSICNVNNYVRASSCNNVPLYDTSNRFDLDQLFLARNLSYEQRQEVEQQVRQLLNHLHTSYCGFLQYVRSTYPEVNLAGFVGW
jgi:hypothetical protein